MYSRQLVEPNVNMKNNTQPTMFSDSEPSGRVFSTWIYTKVPEKRKPKPVGNYCCLKQTTAAFTTADLFHVLFHFLPLAYLSGQDVSSCGGVEMLHL